MPVLCQVTPGPRFLRPERWSNGVDTAYTCNQRLSVQLPALSQLGVFIEIFHLKQGRAAFPGSRGESWNLNLGEPVFVKPVANRGENDRPHSQNRTHLVTPNKQMSLVQEKLGTMELFRDRKLLKSRMHDSPFSYLNLSPARRTGISFHIAS